MEQEPEGGIGVYIVTKRWQEKRWTLLRRQGGGPGWVAICYDTRGPEKLEKVARVLNDRLRQ